MSRNVWQRGCDCPSCLQWQKEHDVLPFASSGGTADPKQATIEIPEPTPDEVRDWCLKEEPCPTGGYPAIPLIGFRAGLAYSRHVARVMLRQAEVPINRDEIVERAIVYGLTIDGLPDNDEVVETTAKDIKITLNRAIDLTLELSTKAIMFPTSAPGPWTVMRYAPGTVLDANDLPVFAMCFRGESVLESEWTEIRDFILAKVGR